MFEKEILERLREMYHGGMTHDELSKALGISASYIGNILSGKQPVKNPTVELLFKVFPRATINLDGNNAAFADRGATAIANAGQGNNFFTDRNAAVADYRLKAMDAVLALNLSPDATSAVLRALKEVK